MKFPWTVVALTAINTVTVNPKGYCYANNYKKNSTSWTIETETLVKERLSDLKLPFQVDYDPSTMFYVKRYLTNGRKATARILGRSGLYFPIFEHELKINGLPQALRYVPMIESDLRPYSNSGVGAGGLWQFMKSTARLYDLKVNAQLDERFDPFRASEAASKLLSALHVKYCDWALVLAAYNCGEVRLNKAIRLAGSRQYNKVKKYLPQETQRYISRFVAAAYITEYYAEHGITPNNYKYNFREIRTLEIYQAINFDQIEEVTSLDQKSIYLLNPGYLGKKINASKKGSYIMLPETAAEKLRSYLTDSKSVKTGISFQRPLDAFEQQHVVKVGQSLALLAERFGCLEEEILFWNQLKPSSKVKAGQTLNFYFKPEVLHRSIA